MFNRKKSRSGTKPRSSRRSSRQRSGGAGVGKKIATWFAILAVPVTVIGGGGVLIKDIVNKEVIDKLTFCYDRPNQHYRAFFIDYSTTRMYTSHKQLREVYQALNNTYATMPPNGRLDVFTSSKKSNNSLAKPLFSICRPANTLAEQADIGIPEVNLARLKFIAKQAKAEFDSSTAHMLTDSKRHAKRDRWDSPLFKNFRAISRYYKDVTLSDFTIYSAGINVDEKRQFCHVKDHLPSFGKLRLTRYYTENKPFPSFGNTNVLFLMAEFPNNATYRKYCKPTELYDHWQAYFKFNKANIEMEWLSYGNETTPTLAQLIEDFLEQLELSKAKNKNKI